MLPSYLTIIAVVGLVFLIALYCHLTGSDDALDEIADGDEGVGARPFGKPALVSDQAAARLDPTGFDPARIQRRLDVWVAVRDAERGRPLTDAEKLDNLARWLREPGDNRPNQLTNPNSINSRERN